MFRSIRDALVFAVAASEETPAETDVSPPAINEDGPIYSVGFDPLDGSSIIDANFSGTIYRFLFVSAYTDLVRAAHQLFAFVNNLIVNVCSCISCHR